VGKTNILYIVLAYVRPLTISAPNSAEPFAIDSYLADIWDQYSAATFIPAPTGAHRYYADVQNQGNVYTPFVPFATFRAQPRSSLIYSVWRLDGPTPEIAKGLVDKATLAANNATGAACIDRNQGDMFYVQDAFAASADWDLHQAAVFLAEAGIPVTEDPAGAEFGHAPAPLICPADGSPVAFYSGWYSLNEYNGPGVFNWAPGAIGFHLDSGSAVDPRGGTNWSANALLKGITVTSGAVGEPYLQGLARPGGLFRNLLEGANVGDAFLRNTQWLKWRIINIGDPLYRPFPVGGKAPFNPPAPLNSFGIAPRSIVGGAQTTGTITLAAAAPPGGTTVNLIAGTGTSPYATVPPSVVVPAGSKTVSFPITTSSVTERLSLYFTANAGSWTRQNTISYYPLLAGIGLSQNSVSGGQTIAGGIFLNASAQPGGTTVNLVSTDPTVATVPATVVVPAGLGRVQFPINTFAVTTTKTTVIQATYSGVTVSATLTANP
jgi:uncharacterized protein (TIGR03790 family)